MKICKRTNLTTNLDLSPRYLELALFFSLRTKGKMRVSATALLSLLFVVLVTAIYGQTTNTQCPVGPDSLTDNFPIDGATVPQICIGGFGLNQSEDYDRCFYIYVPDCAGPDSPLVFDIHGRSSCPLLSTTYTLWAEKATENCFVVVWPLVSANIDFPFVCVHPVDSSN